MPEDFMRCAKMGRVYTKPLGPDRYIKVCQMPSGKWVRGEVHVKKTPAAKAKK
jgi:hypothetical protein